MVQETSHEDHRGGTDRLELEGVKFSAPDCVTVFIQQLAVSRSSFRELLYFYIYILRYDVSIDRPFRASLASY